MEADTDSLRLETLHTIFGVHQLPAGTTRGASLHLRYGYLRVQRNSYIRDLPRTHLVSGSSFRWLFLADCHAPSVFCCVLRWPVRWDFTSQFQLLGYPHVTTSAVTAGSIAHTIVIASVRRPLVPKPRSRNGRHNRCYSPVSR